MGTLNSIKKKLTSQTGASITFALLLFLVCAVVSSVVLAAATAASGRISGSVSSDQRYYSVTSAVQLLKKNLDGKSTKIVFTDANNDQKLNEDEKNTAVFGDQTAANTLPSPLGIMEVGAVVVSEWDSTLTKRTLTLSFPESTFSDEDTKRSVAVTIEQEIIPEPEPKMILNVYNSDATNGTYKLCLTFTADVTDNVSKKKTKNSSGEETITYTDTKTITWNYHSIETIGATTAATTDAATTAAPTTTPGG